MASILDIENTLSDETTKKIILHDWYWNEFLPKIDKDNIKSNYYLVYQSFTIAEFMHLPYNITDERWDWLVKNQIVITDHFNYKNKSNFEKWVYDEIRSSVYKENIIKYAFSDKFFEDYQKNVRERRALTALESRMDLIKSPHRLYSSDKTVNDLKKYAWPRSYEPII